MANSINVLHCAEENHSKFEKSPFHQIIWISCPKCGEKFWFPKFEDTPQEEIDETNQGFVKELIEQGCNKHPQIIQGT